MNRTRVARNLSAGVVAAIAAVASYSHQRDLAAHHGQTHVIAALIPISVDGMLAVATAAMHDDRTNNRHIRVWAWIILVLGVGASIAANTLAAPPFLLDRIISAWPAIALLGVVEVLANPGKPKAADTHQTRVSDEPVPAAQPADGDAFVTPRVTRTRLTAAPKVARAAKALPGAPMTKIAARAGVSETTARRHLNGAAVLDEATIS